MKRRSRGGRSKPIEWRKAPKVVLLVGGAIALGWLAIKTAAVDALVRRNPMAAAAFAPGDPRIPARLAMIEFRQRGGQITPATAKATIRSVKAAPLADEPFFVAALDSLVKRDDTRGEALLLEARRRNPRTQTTRIFLLDRYLRTGRVQEAAAEIAAIGRLVPGSAKVLAPQLAKFAVDPRTRGSLVTVLRSDPDTRDLLLTHLAGTSANPDLVLEVAGPLRPNPASTEPPAWQGLLLGSLVEKGNIAKARELWGRFSGVPVSDMPNVYDASFSRRPGSPPFNWNFVSSPAGVAEPTKTGALEINYYGREEAVLASQLLSLKPGRYRLAFLASGDVPERGSGLSWRVVCHPSKTEVATIPILSLSYAAKPFRYDLIVPPENCPAQWLRLAGTSAEFPTALNVTISKFQVERVGNP